MMTPLIRKMTVQTKLLCVLLTHFNLYFKDEAEADDVTSLTYTVWLLNLFIFQILLSQITGKMCFLHNIICLRFISRKHGKSNYQNSWYRERVESDDSSYGNFMVKLVWTLSGYCKEKIR